MYEVKTNKETTEHETHQEMMIKVRRLKIDKVSYEVYLYRQYRTDGGIRNEKILLEASF